MVKKIKARFSHGVFTPIEKVEFPENEELEITIEEKANMNNEKKKEEIDFATWPLGVKGKLTRREIFDLQLVATMLSNNVTNIYTFNQSDFSKFKEIEVLTP